MTIAEAMAEWVALHDDQPFTAPMPAEVWVAYCAYTRAVAINQQPSTQPLTMGRMGIFNKPQIEEHLSADILGVYTTEQDAHSAVNQHKTQNAQLAADYGVVCKKIGFEAPPPPAQTPPEPNRCITCGTPTQTTFCPPCQNKHWASCRTPGWDAE